MICTNCNKEMGHVEAKFCPHCGTSQKPIEHKKGLNKKLLLAPIIIYGVSIIIWLLTFTIEDYHYNKMQMLKFVELAVWFGFTSFVAIPSTFCLIYCKGNHKKTLKTYARINLAILLPLGIYTFIITCRDGGMCFKGVIEMLMVLYFVFSYMIVGLYSKLVLKND